ncbi:1-phosphatidylinositol 4,5-bisphosphate phosphodiesterase beta-1-like [Glandiceps talaboti]
MASGNTAGFRRVCQLKPIDVKETFIKGSKFIKWDDDSTVGTPVTLRVDPKGYYLYWRNQNKEVDSLELSYVRDTRIGRYAKVPKEGKLKDTCMMGSPDVSLENKTVTIVYGQDFVNTQIVNFCANKEAIAKEWTDELLDMACNMLALNASPLQYWEKMYSKLIITSPMEGKVPVKHILKMFSSSKDDRKRVDHALQAAGLPAGKNDVIPVAKFTFDDFFIFYSRLTHRAEIDKVFQETGAKNKPYLTVQQFVKFLNSEQRDPRLNEVLFPLYTEVKARELIDDYEPNGSFAKKGHISIEGFTKYLMSFDNYIVMAEKYELHDEDMDHPLAHYFINSSHNTYLTGHQLTGKSTVEIYRQCLLAGCRCVELDCWDGKAPEEEPIITHGYTMCTEISFKDVIEAIAESAFKTSDFPVILSFENHCSPKQQAKMANYCRNIFGDMLLIDALEEYVLKPGVALPSPKALLRKIIVKNKKKKDVQEKTRKRTVRKQSSSNSLTSSKTTGNVEVIPIAENNEGSKSQLNTSESKNGSTEYSDGNCNGKNDAVKSEALENTGKTSADDDDETKDTEIVEKNDETSTTEISDVVNTTKKIQVQEKRSTSSEKTAEMEKMDTIDEFYESDSDDEREGLSKEEQKARQREKREKGTAGQEVEAGAEMSALVNYVTPVHFHTFDYSDKRNRCYELSSFVESTALLHVKGKPIDFVNYNKRQLSRIYPKGTRIDSVNYMPQVFWNVGCQLVALNFQSLDLAMQLNMGIFEYNGRCGYILKPDFMRRTDRRFDPFAESTVDGIVAGTVSVKVISGQFLSDKKVSTYVEVDMYGLPADTVRKRFRTKTVQGNGINPIYDEEPFVFKKVVLPNLAMLRIAVHEENGRLIGHRIFPLEGIRPGYRHIALRSEANLPLTLPTLFIHISVKDYVPDTLTDFAAALANPIAYQNMIEKREKQLQELTEDFENEDTDELDQFGLMKNSVKKTESSNSNAIDGTAGIGGKKALEARRSNDSMGGVMVGGYTKVNGGIQAHNARVAAGQIHGKNMVIRKESNLSSMSGMSYSSDCNTSALRNMQHRRSLINKNSIAEEELQRTKSAPMLGQTPEFEAAELDEIKLNKKYQKLIRKHNKELEKLIKKHEKTQSKLKKSQTLEMDKLLISHHQIQTRLQKKHNKSIKKVNKTKNGDLAAVKSDNDREMQILMREHNQEVNETGILSSEVLLAMYRDHYRAEKELKEKQLKPQYELLRAVMVNTHDNQLRDLYRFHKREESGLQKRMYIQNREEMRTLNKRIRNKQELQRLKREFQQKHISQAVTARKTLSDFQERKRKQIAIKMKKIQDELLSEEKQALKDIEEEFIRRCTNLEKDATLEDEGLIGDQGNKPSGDKGGVIATTSQESVQHAVVTSQDEDITVHEENASTNHETVSRQNSATCVNENTVKRKLNSKTSLNSIQDEMDRIEVLQS